MSTAWRSLAAEIVRCRACPELAQARQQVVVGEPPCTPGPGLALVGEAPGAAEDMAGRPFVGKAGQLLDTLLAEAGLDRAGVAVLNVLKCRPPGNRAPKPDEVARCRPFLERQLSLLPPSLVVALGLTAATWFLGRTTLRAARGTVHPVTIGGHDLRVIATYHPSAAIRFGPRGAPLAALREDLALAARLVAVP
jgi:uracil-DNA glycosylase